MSKFTQLAVWRATIVGENNKHDFEKFFKEEFDCEVCYVREVKTLPNEQSPGDRNDVFFYVSDKDISKFAVKRFQFGGEISWFEDVVNNEPGIYPEELIDKYWSWNKEDRAFNPNEKNF